MYRMHMYRMHMYRLCTCIVYAHVSYNLYAHQMKTKVIAHEIQNSSGAVVGRNFGRMIFSTRSILEMLGGRSGERMDRRDSSCHLDCSLQGWDANDDDHAGRLSPSLELVREDRPVGQRRRVVVSVSDFEG